MLTKIKDWFEEKKKIYMKGFLTFLQMVSFIVAAIFIGFSFFYIVHRRDLFHSNFISHWSITESVSFIGIMVTSAISILLYLVSRHTKNINDKLHKMESFRFKMDIFTLYERQKDIISTLSDYLLKLEEVKLMLAEYVNFELEIKRELDIKEKNKERTRRERIADIEKKEDSVYKKRIKKFVEIFNEPKTVKEKKESLETNYHYKVKEFFSKKGYTLKFTLERVRLDIIKIDEKIDGRFYLLLQLEIERDVYNNLRRFGEHQQDDELSIVDILDASYSYENGAEFCKKFSIRDIFKSNLRELNDYMDNLSKLKEDIQEKFKKIYN